MRNIITIIREDFQKISKNVVAIVIIVGLTVIPSLYAWYNIQASWDPYGKTGVLKIAIASDDEGYDGELAPIPLNIGNIVLPKIQKNTNFQWVSTDSKKAIEGVKSGEYYAAIVIPEDFSNNVMSLFTSDITPADIEYYSNEKENAIASKITATGANTIKAQIDATVKKSVVQMILNLVEDLLSHDNAKTFTKNAVGQVIQNLEGMQQQIRSMQATCDALDTTTESLITLLESADDASISTDFIEREMQRTLPKLDSVKAVKDLAKVTGGDLSRDFTSLAKNLQKVKTSRKAVVKDLGEANKNISSALARTKKNLKELQKTLHTTKSSLKDANDSLDRVIGKLQSALERGDMSTLRKILGEDSDVLSSFLATPVTIEEESIYPVANYGSAMAPFYTSLAIWVGGTILGALLFTEISEERRKRMWRLTYTQEYFGRYFLFLVIGLLQAFVICGGDLWFLGIQCLHPAKFMLAGLVSALVFGNIAYTLAASFGNIGKGICVVLLVIQVAGSGGTFPIEMEPAFFRAVYPLLPFTHSMAAMRETIAGCYGNTYWQSLGTLFIYLALSLLLGVVLRRPIIKLNRMIRERLEETKVM